MANVFIMDSNGTYLNLGNFCFVKKWVTTTSFSTSSILGHFAEFNYRSWREIREKELRKMVKKASKSQNSAPPPSSSRALVPTTATSEAAVTEYCPLLIHCIIISLVQLHKYEQSGSETSFHSLKDAYFSVRECWIYWFLVGTDTLLIYHLCFSSYG